MDGRTFHARHHRAEPAGGGSLGLASNASVVNNGLWEDQGTGSLTTFNAAGGRFTNNGVYRKTAAGNSFLAPPVLNNPGTIEIQAGVLPCRTAAPAPASSPATAARSSAAPA